MQRRPRPRHVENLEPRQLLALTVANIEATDVTVDSASIGAEVVSTDGEDPVVTIYWGDEDGGIDIRQWDHAENLGARAVGQHLLGLTDLNPSTDYFFRSSGFAFMGGSVWADQSSTFSTLDLPAPTASLQVGTSIGDSSAQLTGSVDEGSEVTSLTVYFGTIDGGTDPNAWQKTHELDASVKTFSTFADGLLSNTEYFARLAAANGPSIGWSDPVTFTTVSVPPLRISEWMASNATVLPTRIRLSADDSFAGPLNSFDWLDIQNSTDAPIDIGGFFLTDSLVQLTRWQIPDGTMVDAQSSLTILASSKNVVDPQLDELGLLHTNFGLSSSGEYLALVDRDGTTVVDQIADYPDQQLDISYGFFGNEIGQLVTPTPSAANLPIAVQIDNVTHEVQQDSSMVVTAELSAGESPVRAVQLNYRVMYETEVSVAMNDDGQNGDAIAGDGTYAGLIPSGITAVGQMVRYRIQAINEAGVESRLPRFLDDAASPEYFGTVVDASIESRLPVLHRFMERASRAETGAGTQASIYFNGEFYDNVFIRIRGGTARSWPKKSYKIEFNDGYHFRFDEDERRVDEFNLNTTYTDKSYVRAVMSYELYDGSGGAGPMTFPMRVEQNGEFFSVALFVEQPDRDFLRRNELDPDGALYKARHDRLNGLTGRAAGFFEKKTRHFEDETDLQALIDGLTLTGDDLDQFLFDHVDVPAQINLMAVNLILQNIDATDKNYYIYRDTEGNQEWQMLPWDLDLVLGPNALNTDNLVYDEQSPPAHTSHPYLGTLDYPFHGRKNHLFDAIINSPRTNEMFLRRVRSLMDNFLASSDTPEEERFFESKIDELVSILGPDVLLDKERWGRSADYGGRSFTLEEAAERIKTEYLEPRRQFLFETHNIDRLEMGEINTIVPEFPESVQYFVPTDDDLGTTWTGIETPTNIDQWQTGQLGFGFGRDAFSEFINTEVVPKDSCDSCTSVYMRIPFALDSPASIEELTLRMRYDDGFVAYVNGVEVIRQNLRGDNPLFDSRATSHRNNEAVVFENFDISSQIQNLNLSENNILAIHGINSSASSNDMLFSAELAEGVFADADAVGIPHQQKEDPTLELASFDANPASGNQDEEYLEVLNTFDEAVDLTGWKLTGDIEQEFRAGTVVLPGESIYISPNSLAFRSRSVGPTGGMGLLVQDTYDGSLANATTVELVNREGQVVDRLTPAGLPGDFDNDGEVTSLDVDQLCHAVREGSREAIFDLALDGKVDEADLARLVNDILNSTNGDANADGQFNSRDLVQIFQAGEYEDDVVGNSTWSEGDWNCDGEFSSADLVVAFQAGGYQQFARTDLTHSQLAAAIESDDSRAS